MLEADNYEGEEFRLEKGMWNDLDVVQQTSRARLVNSTTEHVLLWPVERNRGCG